MSWEFLVLFDNPPDPGHHLGDPGVDAGVLGLGTADAPRHNPDLCARAAADEERAAAVALARVLAGGGGLGTHLMRKYVKLSQCLRR